MEFQDVSFPERKRNLIIVLSESLENTFNNPDLFGERVMPGLYELQRRHLAFSGHRELPGTEWTIAGITAYFFGLPLKLPTDRNNYSRFGAFLPNAVSSLDIMTRANYEITVILGSKSSFSGKDTLFSTHAPSARVWDLRHFLATRDDAAVNVSSGWGLPDWYILERAKDYLAQYDSPEPFCLIVETVDTHTGTFFVKDGNTRRLGEEVAAFSVQSELISGFISWVQNQPFYENTTLIVLGDHLLMQDSLGGIELEGADRSAFNLFVNVPEHLGRSGKTRRFSSVDICPTILESIGVTLPGRRFGLGVSLFGEEPTLLELFGEDRLSHEFRQKSSFYNSFY